MISKKFDEHKSAQAVINYCNDNYVNLQSYKTIVVEIIDNWLIVNGLYSATTRKHIGWFMRLYGLTYQDAKMCYENNLMINIETGEILYRQ